MEDGATCRAAGTVHTIGHSTRSLEEFLALLETHRIDALIDVRRWPSSRRFPRAPSVLTPPYADG